MFWFLYSWYRTWENWDKKGLTRQLSPPDNWHTKWRHLSGISSWPKPLPLPCVMWTSPGSRPRSCHPSSFPLYQHSSISPSFRTSWPLNAQCTRHSSSHHSMPRTTPWPLNWHSNWIPPPLRQRDDTSSPHFKAAIQILMDLHVHHQPLPMQH